MSRLMARCFVLVFGAVMGSASAVSAGLTNAEVNAGIQFNFSTPGARSLGMGGAFLGMADDATAAFSNPAGLTLLSKPEISFEFRDWSFENEFTDGGHGFVRPTGIGIDVVSGLTTGRSSSETSGLSFFSFVYPKERWSLALYRHEVVNFEAGFETDGAFFDALPQPGGNLKEYRFLPIIADMDLLVVNLGVSFAVRVSDRVSFGLGVSNYFFEIDSLTRRFVIPDGEFYSKLSTDPDELTNFQEQLGDDEDISLNFGLHFKVSDTLSLGLVFRAGPSFVYSARSTGLTRPGDREVDETRTMQPARFNLPDVVGLGIAWRPSGGFSIGIDYHRVNYSVLAEGTVNIFSESDPLREAALENLSVADGEEFHLGFEYVFANLKYPVALRWGGWSDPDHKISFDSEPSTSLEERITAALFMPGEDEIHYSLGFGIVFGETFQLDVAADFSDVVDTVSISGVLRF